MAAAKEFNIGKETLVEFLTGKGFDINASNPNTKLTEQMYDALQAEFAQDRAAKRKSDEIALPKGSLLEGIKKTREDLELPGKKAEVQETPAPAPAPSPASAPGCCAEAVFWEALYMSSLAAVHAVFNSAMALSICATS